MRTVDFLRAVMPSEGVFFAAEPQEFIDKNTGESRSFYKHYPCDSVEQVSLVCKSLSNQGTNAFFAVSGFRSASYVDERTGKTRFRTGDNAYVARSMWLDIDCGVGPKKPYDNQSEGLTALRDFLKKTKLPMPTFIVSSGYGLHIYWSFTKDIPKEIWLPVANAFKALVLGTGFKVDPAPPADIARVLRPVGSFNYKRGGKKEVKVLKERSVLRFSDWARAISKATKDLNIKPPKAKPKSDLNSALSGGLNEYPPSDANKIADKCAALREMRDYKGSTQDEQQWYYALGILRHVEQSDIIAHDWSSGHEGYDPAQTDAKLAQWEAEAKGPTLCDTMRTVFDACATCKMKCNSPITLGFPDPEHQTQVEVRSEDGDEDPIIETLPSLPKELAGDFAWVEGRGLLAKKEDQDGNVINVPICAQFPVPEFIFYDTKEEMYFVRIAARTGPHKWQRGDVSLEVVQRGGITLVGALGGKCAITVRDDGKLLARYMKTWVDVVRQSTDLRIMRDQMGWQKDGSFLLGNVLFMPDGTSREIVVARGLVKYAEAHAAKGDMTAFVDTIDKLYNNPNYLEYQFFWLASFGSVLLKFLHSHPVGITIGGYSGETGTGKTSVVKAGLANFGDPAGLGQKADGQDGVTEYAATVMSGIRHNLPVLIDETSNWTNDRMSKFLYRVASGTAKLQGAADGGLRDTSRYNWNSFTYITTNSPLSGKLNLQGEQAEAVIARLFEVEFDNKKFDTQHSRLFETLWQNSGLTGTEFIRYVVKHQDKVAELCDKMLRRLNKKANATQGARFWMMLIATTVTAAHITKKLGIHRFDVNEIEEWAVRRVKFMAERAGESMQPVEDIARAMLSDIQNGMIVTADEPKKPQDFTPFAPGYTAPRAKVTARYILESGDIYIPINIVKSWCAERNANYTSLKKRMKDSRWLVNSGVRYDIGRGTAVPSTRTRCWKINFENTKKILSVIDPSGWNDDETEINT